MTEEQAKCPIPLVHRMKWLKRRKKEAKKKSQLIKFILDSQYKGLDIPAPTQASKIIPEWYKKLKFHPEGMDKFNTENKLSESIKACVPFMDNLTAGYIIPLPTDVYVEKQKDKDGNSHPYFRWSNMGVFSQHSKHQIGEMPVQYKEFQGKWNSPWIIETPPGYSVMFRHCKYHTLKDEYGNDTGKSLPWNCHEGIIDSDNYFNQINIPFDWIDSEFEGLIPAGTPMVQIIPFKRENWKSEVITKISEEDSIKHKSVKNKIVSSIRNGYKRFFWKKKNFN